MLLFRTLRLNLVWKKLFLDLAKSAFTEINANVRFSLFSKNNHLSRSVSNPDSLIPNPDPGF